MHSACQNSRYSIYIKIDREGMPQHRPVDAALLRHLLSFQSAGGRHFPQGSLFCDHVGTRDHFGFACPNLSKLSQLVTLCPILTHFEICKRSSAQSQSRSFPTSSSGSASSSAIVAGGPSASREGDLRVPHVSVFHVGLRFADSLVHGIDGHQSALPFLTKEKAAPHPPAGIPHQSPVHGIGVHVL